jgi:centrin-3
LFDSESTGFVGKILISDYNELKTIIKALGFQIKKQELMELMKEYDLDNEGRINFTDYTSLSK